jgi:hypothetical protein
MSGACGVPPVYGVRFPAARAAYEHVGFGEVETADGTFGDAEPVRNLREPQTPFGHRRSPAAKPNAPAASADSPVIHGLAPVRAHASPAMPQTADAMPSIVPVFMCSPLPW